MVASAASNSSMVVGCCADARRLEDRVGCEDDAGVGVEREAVVVVAELVGRERARETPCRDRRKSAISSSSARSASWSANSGTQMMSARSTSGRTPPAIPVTSFWRRSSYGISWWSTVTFGIQRVERRQHLLRNVVISAPSAAYPFQNVTVPLIDVSGDMAAGDWAPVAPARAADRMRRVPPRSRRPPVGTGTYPWSTTSSGPDWPARDRNAASARWARLAAVAHRAGGPDGRARVAPAWRRLGPRPRRPTAR